MRGSRNGTVDVDPSVRPHVICPDEQTGEHAQRDQNNGNGLSCVLRHLADSETEVCVRR
jgi:hypothetical protein